MPWTFDSQAQAWTLSNSGGGGRNVVIFNEQARGDVEFTLTTLSYLHEVRLIVRTVDGKDGWEIGFASIGANEDSNLSASNPRERRYAFVLRPVKAGQVFTNTNAGNDYDTFWGFPIAYFPFQQAPRTLTPTGDNTQDDYDTNTVFKLIEECGLAPTDVARTVTIRVRLVGTKIEAFCSTQADQRTPLLSVQDPQFFANPTKVGVVSGADTSSFPTHHTNMATTTGPLNQSPLSNSRLDYPVTADDKWRDGTGAGSAVAGFGAGQTNGAVPVAIGTVPAVVVTDASIASITESTIPYQRQLCIVAAGQLNVSVDGANPSPVGGLDMTRDQPISGCAFQQAAFFVDGAAVRKYDPTSTSGPSVQKFDPTNGLEYTTNEVYPFPGQVKNSVIGKYEPGTTTAFLITAHLNKIWVVEKDAPQNIRGSATGDAADWNRLAEIPGRAIDTSTDTSAVIGEPITMLAPARDDRMVIGTSNKIYVMSGDPALNDARIDLSTNEHGVVGPLAFAYSNDNLCFVLTGEGLGVISGTEFKSLCDGLLKKYAFPNTHSGPVWISMIRDGTRGGIVICYTRVNASGLSQSNQRAYYQDTPSVQSVHLWFHESTGRFFPLEFPTGADPICSVKVDGVVYFGCRDGRVRKLSDTAYSDSTSATTSEAIDAYMPLRLITPGDIATSLKLTKMEIIMSTNSSPVRMVFHSDDIIEDAYKQQVDLPAYPSYEVQVGAGRNTLHPRVRGNAIIATILNSELDQTFHIEAVNVNLTVCGRVGRYNANAGR